MKPALDSTVLLCLCVLAACREDAAPPAAAEKAPPSDRIAVPEAVRKNLGIEYVAVERRRVAQTLRLPGHFELLPAARHEHRTPLAGRVDVRVQPLQPVAAGDLLYRIDSPEWARMQRELGEIATAVQVAQARITALRPLLDAYRLHEESLREAIAVMEANIAVLEQTRATVGGQSQELAGARVQAAQVRADLAEGTEKHAETLAMLAELEANLVAGRDRFQLALHAAAIVVMSTPAQLLAEVEVGGDKRPAWRAISTIEVRAVAAGIADQLPVATGVWVEVGDLVVTVTDLGKVRFRARGLQSDLVRLQAGLPAEVTRPQVRTPVADRIPGTLMLGAEADPAQRTLDLFLLPANPPAWARPGVAGFLEVETRGGADAELAIPLSAVMQDGLERVFFRRDPADADQVIRTVADLGLDDGRWVEVKSGMKDGDSVVLAGAYELMLASSGTASKGGHFHADGTFHAGEDKK